LFLMKSTSLKGTTFSMTLSAMRSTILLTRAVLTAPGSGVALK
jgi:hypothetical protein